MFFPEEYHVPSIRRRLAPDSSKSLKLTTLSHFYRRRHQPEGGAKKRGAPRRRANPDAEESELAGKLTDFLDKDLLMFNRVERVLAESGVKESPVPETVVMQREYFYPLETRCRRCVTDHGSVLLEPSAGNMLSGHSRLRHTRFHVLYSR